MPCLRASVYQALQAVTVSLPFGWGACSSFSKPSSTIMSDHENCLPEHGRALDGRRFRILKVPPRPIACDRICVLL
jgi:hypothetical protein